VVLADEMSEKIAQAAIAATTEDRAIHKHIIETAMAHSEPGDHVAEYITMTPGLAALSWESQNFNRLWKASHSYSLSQIMEAGEWRENGTTYGFFGDDGSLGDGVHRTAAQACSGVSLRVLCVMGISKNDVATIDCGKQRTAADAAALSGVADAAEKGHILQACWSYDQSVKIVSRAPHNNVAAIAREIERNDDMLTRAIEIAQMSVEENRNKLLSTKAAARLVAILLRHHWPEDTVIEWLDEIQKEGSEMDNTLIEFAREHIEDHRKPVDTITAARETGVVIKGFQLAESGAAISPTRKKEIRNAQKNPPVPTFPHRDTIPLPAPGFVEENADA
jgi:hypothetical protein